MVSFLIAACLAASTAPSFGPTPDWVVPLEVPLTSDLEGSWVTLLSDRQLRAATSVEVYTRDVWLVRTLSGVTSLATQEFEWEPSWESLTIHGIWVWRDGKRREAWHRDDARLLEAESRRDERIYDGRLTYRVELRDLRAGDVVEVASTVKGENPVMGGRFAKTMSLSRPFPVETLNLSVAWSRERKLGMRLMAGAPAPSVSSKGNESVMTWRLTRPAPIELEAQVPSDVEVWPAVEFSDWADWAEVAAFANRLFAVPSADERTRAEVERLRALPAEKQLREVVRFVQDDIRYVGIELGPHGHLPHAPGWVLERGFGDCKDKALLMVELLRGLGRKAQPVLVASDGFGDTARLPSPFAFDHAIVRVELLDGPRFIDGTERNRVGDPSGWETPALGHVLVVDPTTVGLTPLPEPKTSQPALEITQRWIEPEGSGLAAVKVESTATGQRASLLRSALQNRPRAEFQKDRLELRREDFEQKLEAAGLDWSEDGIEGRVTLTETYDVSTLKLAGDYRLHALAIGEELRLPSEQTRRWPFAVEHPLHLHETIIFQSQTPLDPERFTLTNRTFTTPAFTLTVTQKMTSRRIELEWDYVTLRDRITPAEWGSFQETSREALASLSYGIMNRVEAKSATQVDSAWPLYVGLCFVLLVLVGLALVDREGRPSLKGWFRRWRFRRRQQDSRGASATTAMPVVSLDAARALFRSNACPQGHEWPGSGDVVDTVRLGDQRVTVVGRRCKTCDQTEVRYVILP